MEEKFKSKLFRKVITCSVGKHFRKFVQRSGLGHLHRPYLYQRHRNSKFCRAHGRTETRTDVVYTIGRFAGFNERTL